MKKSFLPLVFLLQSWRGNSQVVDPVESAFLSVSDSLRMFTTVRVGSEEQEFNKVALDTSMGQLLVATLDCDLCTGKNT